MTPKINQALSSSPHISNLVISRFGSKIYMYRPKNIDKTSVISKHKSQLSSTPHKRSYDK